MAESGQKLKKRSEIMRNNSVKFLDILTSLRETLPTLTVRLYQSRLIDKQTKTALLSLPLQQASIAFADCLELKIDQSTKHLTAVLEILKEEEAMKDLCKKIELEIARQKLFSTMEEGKCRIMFLCIEVSYTKINGWID